MNRIALMLPALALASCATVPETHTRAEDPAIAQKLAGLVPGKAQSCIQTIDAHSSGSYAETILYRVGRTLTYRADIPGCTELARDDILVVDVFGSQICRGDIFRLVDRTSGFSHGACAFGDFVPYRKPG